MSPESAADKFSALVVGAMVGLGAGVVGAFVLYPWGHEFLGLILGFCVGDIAGFLVYRAFANPNDTKRDASPRDDSC